MVVAWFGVLGPLASRRPLSALAGVDGDGNNDGGNASPPGAGAGDDDDGGGSLATSSVSVPAADALMPLYATVTVKFGAAAVCKQQGGVCFWTLASIGHPRPDAHQGGVAFAAPA